jgi:hypothetical protein
MHAVYYTAPKVETEPLPLHTYKDDNKHWKQRGKHKQIIDKLGKGWKRHEIERAAGQSFNETGAGLGSYRLESAA